MIRLFVLAIVPAAIATTGCRENDVERPAAATTAAVYACRQTKPVDRHSVWPIPADAEVTASGVLTKRIQPGGGRTPVVGSGQVLLLCVTYYDRGGKILQHDPMIVHDIDRRVPEWQDVLRRMAEGEVRRFWIPPGPKNKDFVIGDFEMQPFPVPDPNRRPPR